MSVISIWNGYPHDPDYIKAYRRYCKRPTEFAPPLPEDYACQEIACFGAGAGAGPGQLMQPRGVAVDADGNVYVSDTQNHRIEKFGPDGAFHAQWRRCEDDPTICQFPNSGAGPGEFFYPRGTVIDAGGDLYVADTSNGRVQRLVQTVVPLPDMAPPSDDSGETES